MIDVHEIKLFQEELRNGATLNEVLVKYGLSLKDALKIARLNKSHQIWCTDYIFRKGNIFFIRKLIDGKQRYLGSFDSLEDAIKVRDILIANCWDYLNLEKYLKIVGVVKHGN